MKRILLLSVFGIFVFKGIALAHAPSIDINMATTILQIPIPSTVNIPINVVHEEVKDLHDFQLTVKDSNGVETSLTDGLVADPPFRGPSNSNACDVSLTTNGFTCNLVSNSEVNVTVPWHITTHGEYVVTARIRHTGTQWDDDDETVTITLISAEYPAPPAVANAYMNAHPEYFPKKNLTGSVRGCVVNQIAKHHAAGDYGLKGGPYNEAWIHADAYAYYELCR